MTALTLYNGSVIAELVRSGVFSLPKGQAEAGVSIGLTPPQVMRSIQLPQALTAMLPALVGQLVVILKDTALGTAVLYPELLQAARDIGTGYSNTIPAYIFVAIIFILINYSLTVVAGRVERRLSRRGRGPARAHGDRRGRCRRGGDPDPLTRPDDTAYEKGPDTSGVGALLLGAPPIGLEPITCRLTAGCSAN